MSFKVLSYGEGPAPSWCPAPSFTAALFPSFPQLTLVPGLEIQSVGWTLHHLDPAVATLPEEEPTLHPVGRQTQGQTSQVWQMLKLSEADVPGGTLSTFPGNPG